MSSLYNTQRLTAKDNMWALFLPDTPYAEEFFDDRRGQSLVFPEQRLMLAILEDALECFREHCAAKHGKRKQVFKNVEQWFFAGSAAWVFDFESICTALDLDPDYVRKGLGRWRDSKYQNTAALLKTRRKSGGSALTYNTPHANGVVEE